MIQITLKNGDICEVEAGTSIFDIAKGISEGLARVACAAKLDGALVDLRTPVNANAQLEILTFDDEGGKHAYWHTTSHVMAQAVKRLYPNAKLAIGPAIKEGFYYDIDVETPFSEEDLAGIQAEMKKIIKEKLSIEKFSLPYDEAIALMEEKNEPYKVELIQDLKESGEELSFYRQGDFVDLCAGPHLMSTGQLKAVKLLNTAGAYWRGNAENKMLCRIYGISYPKQADIDLYLERIEEAKKRDHRKIGKELELFTFMEEGPGFPFFLPKGMELRNTLLDFWRQKHRAAGYTEISTPILLNQSLWLQSGHWDHYRENMYTTTIEDETFCLKPMNCPGSILTFKNSMHSYRDLPIRMAELGLVHRHEASGTLHGLMRVRAFTQDDGHIYMLPTQIKEEVKKVVRLTEEIYSTFGFKYHVELSTRPEDSMGTDEEWDNAINGLRESLEELEIPYVINEGDGAFYGPKIDFHLEDCLGRTWQCGTIQLDFQMPQRFDATYIGEDGEKHRPVMVHRALLGSIERFIGILTEHYAGSFPTWLAPVQVRILPISEKFFDYAEKVEEKLRAADIKVEVDKRNEKIGYKIREAQMKKIPLFIIVGEKESESNTLSVRRRSSEETSVKDIPTFIEEILLEIKEKKAF